MLQRRSKSTARGRHIGAEDPLLLTRQGYKQIGRPLSSIRTIGSVSPRPDAAHHRVTVRNRRSARSYSEAIDTLRYDPWLFTACVSAQLRRQCCPEDRPTAPRRSGQPAHRRSRKLQAAYQPTSQLYTQLAVSRFMIAHAGDSTPAGRIFGRLMDAHRPHGS